MSKRNDFVKMVHFVYLCGLSLPYVDDFTTKSIWSVVFTIVILLLCLLASRKLINLHLSKESDPGDKQKMVYVMTLGGLVLFHSFILGH